MSQDSRRRPLPRPTWADPSERLGFGVAALKHHVGLQLPSPGEVRAGWAMIGLQRPCKLLNSLLPLTFVTNS